HLATRAGVHGHRRGRRAPPRTRRSPSEPGLLLRAGGHGVRLRLHGRQHDLRGTDPPQPHVAGRAGRQPVRRDGHGRIFPAVPPSVDDASLRLSFACAERVGRAYTPPHRRTVGSHPERSRVMTTRTDATATADLSVPAVDTARLYQEGLVAGIIGALTVALWFLVVDVAHGRPLYTPTLLAP